MFSTPLEKVGMPRGAYSERRQLDDGPIEEFCARLVGPAARRLHVRRLELKTFVQQVSTQSDAVKTSTGDAYWNSPASCACACDSMV
jgi:uncharacterized protein (DUF2342 family)